MNTDDEKQLRLAIRKAIIPLLKEEFVVEITKTISSELRKALIESTLSVTIDTELVNKSIADFLANRDAPVIKVEQKDFDVKPLIEAIGKGASDQGVFLEQIVKKDAPRSVADYRPHDQDAEEGSIYAYYGFQDQTGAWYIMRSSATDQRYAGGSSDYSKAWGDRAKQSYGFISEALNG
jgi:hypothetical protein